MSIFHRIGNAIARFMYGRNGVDHLGIATIWLCVILELVSALTGRRFPTAAGILYYVSLIPWFWALFRIFSKNLTRRREENQRWLSVWNRLAGQSRGARARHADKAHKYFTCKSCKTICRVPVGQGNIIITCPKCGSQIRART